MLMCVPHARPTIVLRNVKVGDAIPAFSVQALDGTSIGSEAHRGKVLLMVFVRPEHEKSLRALKVVQEILKENVDSKLAVLAVATKPGTEEHFKRIVAECNLTFPVAMDPGRKTYGEFGVVVAPTTLLIDGGGILRFVLPHMPLSFDRRLRIHTDLMLGKISREEHEKRLSESDQSKVEGQDPWTRRLGLAQRLIEQRNLKEAVALLEQLHAEKSSAQVATLLGTSLLELDRVDEAAGYLEPLAKQGPISPKVKLALGRLEVARGNHELAESHLLDALSRSPKKGPILFDLGRLYERKGDLTRAVKCYREALEEVFEKQP
jgi:peroxiredoxin